VYFAVLQSIHPRDSNYLYRVSPGSDPRKTEAALYAPLPEYPLEARKLGLEGAGLFAVRIGPDGSVESVKPITSTGHPLLDDAAIAGFRRFRFRPGRKVIRASIVFTMRGPQAAPQFLGLRELGDAGQLIVVGRRP
jgi:TonB family protein